MALDVKQLRQQLADAVDQASADLALEEKRLAYERERAGALGRLKRLRSLDPDLRFVVRTPMPSTDLPPFTVGVLGPSAAELVEQAEEHLRQVEDELSRLGEFGL